MSLLRPVKPTTKRGSQIVSSSVIRTSQPCQKRPSNTSSVRSDVSKTDSCVYDPASASTSRTSQRSGSSTRAPSGQSGMRPPSGQPGLRPPSRQSGLRPPPGGATVCTTAPDSTRQRSSAQSSMRAPPAAQRSITRPSAQSTMAAPSRRGPVQSTTKAPPAAQRSRVAEESSSRSMAAATGRPASAASRRQAAPRAPPVDATGQYMMPMEFGPQSRQGKGMEFSDPSDLRSKMESKVPKELKYSSVKPPAGQGRDRKTLQQVPQLKDTLSGSFQVYGGSQKQGPGTAESSLTPSDASFLDHREEGQFEDLSDAEQTMEEMVFAEVMEQYRPTGVKVHSQRGRITESPQQMFMTPAGPEVLLQQSELERTVERSKEGEHIIRQYTNIDLDEERAIARKVELNVQEIDPDYAQPRGSPSEIISVKSTVSVTPSYTTVSKNVSREVVEEMDDLDDLDPAQISKMVEDEKEDVENTLKMVPPDMSMVPEKYGLKKRLQKLRLNSESMGLLEQSVIYPEPKSDEAQEETSPEIMATIMHTVEKGVAPNSAPNQIFNTLFAENLNESFISMSAVAPGPLQDVVVPTQVPMAVHQEAPSQEVEKLTETMMATAAPTEYPATDIFTKVVSPEKKKPAKAKRTKPFKPIFAEQPPWGAEDLEPIVNLVGAEPLQVLAAADASVLEATGHLDDELAIGIEYFLDADPIKCMSRVQLRGSATPSWFPGYMVALPEYQDIVKIASSPSNVLLTAWKAVQPKIIPDDDVVCVR